MDSRKLGNIFLYLARGKEVKVICAVCNVDATNALERSLIYREKKLIPHSINVGEINKIIDKIYFSNHDRIVYSKIYGVIFEMDICNFNLRSLTSSLVAQYLIQIYEKYLRIPNYFVIIFPNVSRNQSLKFFPNASVTLYFTNTFIIFTLLT